MLAAPATPSAAVRRGGSIAGEARALAFRFECEPAPVRLVPIEAARARWASRQPAAYTYELRLSCFCGPELNQWTEVTVRRDTVVAVRPLVSPSAGQPDPPVSWWPTVTQLFLRIDAAVSSTYTQDASASFDAEYGYPQVIEITCKPTIADCGVLYEARNLRAIP